MNGVVTYRYGRKWAAEFWCPAVGCTRRITRWTRRGVQRAARRALTMAELYGEVWS